MIWETYSYLQREDRNMSSNGNTFKEPKKKSSQIGEVAAILITSAQSYGNTQTDNCHRLGSSNQNGGEFGCQSVWLSLFDFFFFAVCSCLFYIIASGNFQIFYINSI